MKERSIKKNSINQPEFICEDPSCVIPGRCFYQGKPTLCGQIVNPLYRPSKEEIQDAADIYLCNSGAISYRDVFTAGAEWMRKYNRKNTK